jgi:transposase
VKGIHSEEDQKSIRGIVFPTNDRLPGAATELPAAARPAVDLLAGQLRQTQERIDAATAEIEAAQSADPLARRLASIPGIGTITASAIAATTPEVDNFRSTRDLFPRTVS